VRLTIRKIAEIANVSRGTVDKVLHNRPGVSDLVRDKVRKVAVALDYRPNIVGKALAGQQHPKTIGVIIAPDYNPFVEDIKIGVQAARDEIFDYGYNIDMRVLNTLDAQEQVNILDSFIENSVDGVALFSIDSEKIRKKIDAIVAQGLPVVTYNSDIRNSNRICFVGQDHYKGGFVAGDLMSNILPTDSEVIIITSLLELACHKNRTAGFKQAIQDFEANISVIAIVENQDRKQSAFEQTLKLIEKFPSIKGIYVTGGGVSGVGEALRTVDKHKDIKIICHDLVESTVKLMRQGVIDFTIGQDPFFQGYKPIKIIFEYLLWGKSPESKFIQTKIDIRSRSTV
jgi:LacI family transcriptional regulator, galactose operon repressor